MYFHVVLYFLRHHSLGSSMTIIDHITSTGRIEFYEEIDLVNNDSLQSRIQSGKDDHGKYKHIHCHPRVIAVNMNIDSASDEIQQTFSVNQHHAEILKKSDEHSDLSINEDERVLITSVSPTFEVISYIERWKQITNIIPRMSRTTSQF